MVAEKQNVDSTDTKTKQVKPPQPRRREVSDAEWAAFSERFAQSESIRDVNP